jgi:putative phosphonate metabolism protein
MGFERYAIYYSPEPGCELAEFGEQWLGRDAYGQPVIKNSSLAGDENLQALIATPARYGFHGTVKPPFRLTRDEHPRRLKDVLDRFVSKCKVVAAPPLKLTTIGNFLALCPDGIAGPNKDIDDLAERCVYEFDYFRAPMSDEELQRKKNDELSSGQLENLNRWGYPFVFDEYRFHLTLTGALSTDEKSRVEDILSPLVEALPNEPFTIRSLCLFGDPGNGEPFRLIERYPLGT